MSCLTSGQWYQTIGARIWSKCMHYLIAAVILCIVSGSCKNTSGPSSAKGTLMEQGVDDSGGTVYRYLYSLTFEDPESTKELVMGQCYWSYESNGPFDRFREDNVGRFCSKQTENVNTTMIELADLMTQVNAQAEANEDHFWKGSQKSWGKRQLKCAIITGAVALGGTIVGGLTGFAGGAPTILGVAVTVPGGAAIGGAVGIAAGNSICDYISADTYQEFDQLAGNISLGGNEAAKFMKDARDQIMTGVAKTQLNPILNNDLSQPPTRVGDDNPGSHQSSQDDKLVTSFLIAAVRVVENRGQKLAEDLRATQGSLANPKSQSMDHKLDYTGRRGRFFVQCDKGGSCSPIPCPRPSETRVCKEYKRQLKSR